MFASTQLDLVVGLDIHMEMVPMPAPVPTPFPMPFVGMIEFSPAGLLLSVGIAGAMSAAFSTPPSGPVLVNGIQATKTGDEAQNKKTLPHMVIPPGTVWTPLPKPLKLKMKPGPPPPPDSPAAPPGDAVMVTGSKTVYFEGSNACRLGTLAMSCSDPVRLPSSALIAIPKGLPVLIGGPPAFDWTSAAKAFFLRNKWTAGLLHQLVSLLKPGRLRSLLGWAACQLTGHPVDVATGRLLTRAKDFELRGPIPLTFERFYSSAWAERDSPLGYGWSHTFDERIWLERGKVVYKAGDGREIEFHTHDLPGRKMQAGQEIFYGIDRLTLRCLGGGAWELRTTDGLTREFASLPGDPQVSRLTKIRNRLGQWVTFEYERGLLDSVRTSEGRWVRLEHRSGRLHRVALPYPYGDKAGWYDQVSFTYSKDGDLVAATDSARHARTYGYEKHLLVRETDRDGVTFYFEYDGRDSTASCVRTWGNDGKGCNRLYFREIVYDRKHRRTLVEDSLGNTTTYEMNIANAVVKIIDPHGAATTTEYNEHLWTTAETDALGHVTRFEYDARGNETKRVLANGAATTRRFDASDRLLGSVDPAGANAAWVYDSRGRFTYDALGRRVSKTSGGTTTRWLWDGDVPVHEWTGGDDASELCTWIFEPESFAPLGKIASDGTSYSVVTDYLGTPTEMFDEAGKLAWRAQLDVYGVPHVAEGTAGDCPWRWPGQYEDQETGLYYNRFRYYDPERGTYLSADPLRLLGSLRLYGYPPDPLRAFDPLGLMPWAWNADDGMGHHLVPRGKANSIGLSDLGSDRNTPTFFPIPYDPGMHEALHRAQSPHVGPLQGPWHGTEASLLAASRAGLDDVSHLRGDLRIPATGQVLARNVTPAEAFDRMSAWHDEKQKEKASACG